MTVTAKELAAALLTYEMAIGEEPPTLATRVNAMRQVLEQFEAGCVLPKIDPTWKPPRYDTVRVTLATRDGVHDLGLVQGGGGGGVMVEREGNGGGGPWEPGLIGIVARPVGATLDWALGDEAAKALSKGPGI